MTPDIYPLTDDDITRMAISALAEDIGEGDVTSNLLIPLDLQGKINFVAREPMVVGGLFFAQAVYEQLGASVTVEIAEYEGERVEAGALLAVAQGSARALLTGERVALNLMQRVCAVATLTAQYVEAVRGTKAIILDTRKTMPGLRNLDKYAVRIGGGQNHRLRLDDMVLIKDNHIALRGGLRQAVALARANTALAIEVECDTLEQLAEAVEAAPDRIMLDNMTPAQLTEAVQWVAGRVPLEASGGVSLESVRNIAETGVDFISVGKLTHSAPGVDIGADMVLDN